MYLPAHFSAADLTHLDALIADAPFVALISVDEDGAPFVSHLPVLYRRDDERILIEGHWARPNPQARHGGSMTMLVQGPQAYISPGVYPDKETAARVPTWNYVIAQLQGEVETFTDTEVLGDLVDRLSRRFEPTVGRDWCFEPEREGHRRQLAGIVGFRFRPRSIALKLKLSQNHPVPNRDAVAADLAARDDANARALAQWMARVGGGHA